MGEPPLEEGESGIAAEPKEATAGPLELPTREGEETEAVTARASPGTVAPLRVALDPGPSPNGASTLERRKRATNRRTKTVVRPAAAVERLRRMAAVPLGRMLPTLFHPTRIIAINCSNR